MNKTIIKTERSPAAIWSIQSRNCCWWIPEMAYSGNKECENIPMSIKRFGDERF